MENKPQFCDALRFWIKLGIISFGGPAGQIAIMHRELVERQKWISEEKFQHALNFCMLLPGPEAQQLATYNGWLLHGTRGGIAAGVFFVVPSIFVLLGLSYVYAKFGEIPQIEAVLDGVKAVVVAIVVEAVIKIGKKSFKTKWHILIAGLAFVAIYFLQIPFPIIILAAGLLGYVLGQIPKSNWQKAKTEEKMPKPSYKLNILKVFAVCFVLWLVPFLILLFSLGWKSLQLKVYLFFTQAAFVTFGGAYAVLAYVNQIAVNSYSWLTAKQAIDGFGLAETTPGPLIMVLQFVGFMAGWNNPGDFDQTFSAVLTALLTTFATFLPCFFFIFAFAPLIEKFQDNVKLKAVISGVTAAVVGVILNLALVFGAAVIYHQKAFNWFALIIGAVSFIVLLRYKIDVLWIVLGGGAIGLIKYLAFD